MLYTYKAKLATEQRWVDGDTYWLWVDLGLDTWHLSKFRLKGADTPEVFGRKASEAGREASKFVEKLLLAQPGKLLIKTFKTTSTGRDKKGKYGRYLADILLEVDEEGAAFPEEKQPMWLAAYLVEKSFAKPTNY
jgi:endonuclease YncB( thermonuclease family)